MRRPSGRAPGCAIGASARRSHRGPGARHQSAPGSRPWRRWCSVSQRLLTQRCTTMSTIAAITNTWARPNWLTPQPRRSGRELRRHVQRRVQRVRVPPQPRPVGEVRRPPAGDQRPEARAVPEHPEVRELVDHDRLERARRGQDEAPREHQPAVPRGAPPSAPGVADVDARRGRRRAPARARRWPGRAPRSPGRAATPRGSARACGARVARGGRRAHRPDRRPRARRPSDDRPRRPASRPRGRGGARRGTARGHRRGRRRAPVPRLAHGSARRGAEAPRPGAPGGRPRFAPPGCAQPRRVASGTDTTRPSRASMVMRRPRERAERRR